MGWPKSERSNSYVKRDPWGRRGGNMRLMGEGWGPVGRLMGRRAALVDELRGI